MADDKRRLIKHVKLLESTQNVTGHISASGLNAIDGYVMWVDRQVVVVTRPDDPVWEHKTVCIPLSNVSSFGFDDAPPSAE